MRRLGDAGQRRPRRIEHDQIDVGPHADQERERQIAHQVERARCLAQHLWRHDQQQPWRDHCRQRQRLQIQAQQNAQPTGNAQIGEGFHRRLQAAQGAAQTVEGQQPHCLAAAGGDRQQEQRVAAHQQRQSAGPAAPEHASQIAPQQRQEQRVGSHRNAWPDLERQIPAVQGEIDRPRQQAGRRHADVRHKRGHRGHRLHQQRLAQQRQRHHGDEERRQPALATLRNRLTLRVRRGARFPNAC